MKESQVLMGMPIVAEILDPEAVPEALKKVFSYFRHVDEKFSVYKSGSEITRINQGKIAGPELSEEMKEVFALAQNTKEQTDGYFDIRTPGGFYDPSGLVKGWAIRNAARILRKDGFKNFYVDAGGDIQFFGKNQENKKWSAGIKNPFDSQEIVKIVYLSTEGIATSGTYIRGQHIYNPRNPDRPISEIVSLTVIGPDVYEADRFATAAFAMGRRGINFLESFPGLEGYLIDRQGIATMTSGFEQYTNINHA